MATISAIHAIGLTTSHTLDLDVLGALQILVVTFYSVTALGVSLRDHSPSADSPFVVSTRVTYVLLFVWTVIMLAGLS